MDFLPTFHLIFISYHTLIYTNDETSQNWMSRLLLQKWNDKFLREFCIYLLILVKYMQRCDTAMLYINEVYLKISKKTFNTLLHKNQFRWTPSPPPLWTDYFETNTLLLLIFYGYDCYWNLTAVTLANFFNHNPMTSSL